MKYYVWIILFLFGALDLGATHIIGGVISYEYLGVGAQPNTNKYEYTMLIYRDCYGMNAPFDELALITFYEVSPTGHVLYSTVEVPLKSFESIPLKPKPCMNPPVVCVQQGTYTFTIDLPLTGNAFLSTYQTCCRNESVNNIYNPLSTGATYSIELSYKAMLEKNSSPRFDELPPVLICSDFPVAHDHSATDKDGDYLEYSFCKALNNVSSNGFPPYFSVNYIKPLYYPYKPMGGDPIVTIDKNTGYIDGVSHLIGQYVLAVCVREYRNGELLSVVRREFQFNVADCHPDIYADIKKDSVIGYKDFYFEACGLDDISFVNKSIGINAIESYLWTFDLNNGSIATSSERHAKISFPKLGIYHGKMLLNKGLNCKDSVFITVKLLPEVKADFSYSYDSCALGPVQFTDLSTGKGGLTEWWWKFGDGNNNNFDKNPIHQYTESGDFKVSLLVVDSNRCHKTLNKIITWKPAPAEVILAPSTFNGCVPADIFFDNVSSPIDTTYSFEWDFGDGRTDTLMSPSHLYEEPGIYSVSLKIATPIGCTAEAYFPNWIRVHPSPVADFSYSPERITTLKPTIDFTDESIGANRWFWNFDSLATTQDQSPSYTFEEHGLHTIYLRVVHPSGCVDSVSKIIDIIPETTFYMPNAFTPNEDTKNDIFLGKGQVDKIFKFRMTIWNRWGQRVFESSSPQVGWNGRKFNTGRLSPAGVYVYSVSYIDLRAKSHKLTGFATLIR